MKNQKLEHELERIANYDEIKINSYINFWDSSIILYLNDNGYLYYNSNDLLLDCIELSRMFKLVFV